MTEKYLAVLQESLQKKLDVLGEILRISRQQSDILAAQTISYEDFDRCVDDKDICLEKLEKLDNGFETTYEKVRLELQEHRQEHADWIKQMQQLIARITDKSVEIQTLEARNKQAVEDAFRKSRMEIRQGKQTAQMTRDYYRNMTRANVVMPQYMDQKK